MPAATRSTGIRSSTRLCPAGNTRCPFSPMNTSGAEVVNPSFHPGKGKRSALSTMAGRTSAYWQPLAAMACSPIALVYVYVLGQPQARARSMPACTSCCESQTLRSRPAASPSAFWSFGSRPSSSRRRTAAARNCAASAPSSACARSRATKESTSLSSASTTKGTCAASSRSCAFG